MKKVIVIGATGKIGKILSEKLSDEADFEIKAAFRNEDKKDFFEDRNIEFTILNLEDPVDKIAEAIEGADVVVFTAGSGGSTGPDKTLVVDLDGAVKSMEAAKKANVNRYVIVSAMKADNREMWDKSGIKPYYVAKHYADRVLKDIGLDYTIIRPGRLLDEDGTGKITTENPEKNKSVPREDVAAVIVEVLKNDNTIGKIVEFNQGDKEISEAIGNI
ncbi:SDR family oxidoreductase [Mangrovivirga sp. M17]|uniref:SDR family oxidoreductase n=1 Tax=Mangrovivirga halotolerans TaxID=2993936 RepID=A0ABT3RR99_9BACT|nr:SDR family oxidoreductase [Mangrovivirga halotolerans]MCX2744021.1 SDR family oxidoreductase [Mangrovivirga halotolerans]